MLALGAEALEPLAPLTPGAPLLRVRSMDPAIEGLEVALKGGQMGDEPVFLRAARGIASASLPSADGMKDWPPKPGLTDISSTMSTLSST